MGKQVGNFLRTLRVPHLSYDMDFNKLMRFIREIAIMIYINIL